jgi:hypothetical protein
VAERKNVHLSGDRTDEFILIADRSLDNRCGTRNRLPLPFGSDPRPVGRNEFASFALLAMPGQRSHVLTLPN